MVTWAHPLDLLLRLPQAVLCARKVQLGLWNALPVCALFPHTLAPAGECFSQLQLLLECQIGLFSAQRNFGPAARTESDAVDTKERERRGGAKMCLCLSLILAFRGRVALLFQSFWSHFSSSDTVLQNKPLTAMQWKWWMVPSTGEIHFNYVEFSKMLFSACGVIRFCLTPQKCVLVRMFTVFTLSQNRNSRVILSVWHLRSVLFYLKCHRFYLVFYILWLCCICIRVGFRVLQILNLLHWIASLAVKPAPLEIKPVSEWDEIAAPVRSPVTRSFARE